GAARELGVGSGGTGEPGPGQPGQAAEREAGEDQGSSSTHREHRRAGNTQTLSSFQGFCPLPCLESCYRT
ncbi:hypothetical protein Nmel_018065, partial [Mimus melanotis]